VVRNRATWCPALILLRSCCALAAGTASHSATHPGPLLPSPPQEGDAGSAHASYNNIAMAGQDVFKFAVRSVPAVSARLSERGVGPVQLVHEG